MEDGVADVTFFHAFEFPVQVSFPKGETVEYRTVLEKF